MFDLIPCKSYNEECYQMTKDGKNLPPGLLQYKVTKNDIVNIDIKNHNNNGGWKFASHSKNNLLRLTPNTKTGNSCKWKIILVMMREPVTGGICMKGVLQNQTRPDEYALMTSRNKLASSVYSNRTVASLDIDYKICFCKMIAPPKFWHEFKNRLLY